MEGPFPVFQSCRSIHTRATASLISRRTGDLRRTEVGAKREPAPCITPGSAAQGNGRTAGRRTPLVVGVTPKTEPDAGRAVRRLSPGPARERFPDPYASITVDGEALARCQASSLSRAPFRSGSSRSSCPARFAQSSMT